MLARLRFLGLYIVLWVGCFESGRILFLLYQWRNTSRLDASLFAGALLWGLRMDLSLACALTIIPLSVVAQAGFLPVRAARRIIVWYTVAMLAFWAVATVADLELFRAWGYRLDSTPLHYVRSSHEAFASADGSPFVLLIVVLLTLLAAAIVVFRHALVPWFDRISPSGRFQSILLLAVVTPGLALGIRGGFNWRVPISESSVYFSRDNFANQAAVNPVWNLAASVIRGSGDLAVAKYADRAVAQAVVDSLLAEPPRSGNTPDRSPSLLRTRPQKIILLFWEGFTAKIVEPLGGERGVTANFTRLSKEGILFDGLYASGPRTTNGLLGVLSGFPSHPMVNPLGSAERAAALPRLSAIMVGAGYRTGFYYGGSLAFDNRNRYLFGGRWDVIVEKKDFARGDWKSPWGVHDPIVLDRLFRAVNSAKAPIFAVTLTLSSHEPFDVPLPAVIRGTDSEHRFLNAQAFSDRAVSQFVERAKAASWWDNTLLIIVADHGSPYPAVGSPLASAPEQYRIPMLWLGGSLAVRDTVIHHIASQTDIAKTLLGQLGLTSRVYKWGIDILAPGARSFAFYSFSNGFGYVDSSGSYVFDNVEKGIIHKTGNPSTSSVRAGRAFQQMVMQEYVDLSAPHGH